MNQRWLLNLALLAVVGILILLVVFEPGKETEDLLVALSTLNADVISNIRIEYGDQPAIVLKKTGDQWQMLKPYAIAANCFRIDSLLGITKAKSRAQLSITDDELRRFELDPPRGRLIVDKQVFEFGATEAIDRNRYIRTDGVVHLTTDRFYHHVVAGAATYINRSLLGEGANPTAIRLPDLTLRLEQGVWTTTPEQEDAGMDAINTLIDAWRHAQAFDVKPLPLDHANEGTIDITLEGQDSPLQFIILASELDLVLGRRDVGLSWHLGETFVQSLLRLQSPQEMTQPDAETVHIN